MTLWKYKKKNTLEIKHNSKAAVGLFLWLFHLLFVLCINPKYRHSIFVKAERPVTLTGTGRVYQKMSGGSLSFTVWRFWHYSGKLGWVFSFLQLCWILFKLKVWKNSNIYKVIYIASVVAYNLLSFRDIVVVSWQNLIRLSLPFTFVGFGAIFFGSVPGGGRSCIHLFHFASIHLSREPGEYSVASGTEDVLDSRRSWFDMCSKDPEISLGWNPRLHPVIMRKCHTYLEEEHKETVTSSIHFSFPRFKFEIWTWYGGAL